MSSQRIKFPRISDRAIADVYKQLGEQYEIPNVYVSALGYVSLDTVNLKDDSNKEWEALLQHDSYLIESMSITIWGLHIAYARGGQNPPEQKSPIYDELVLTWNNPQLPNRSLTNTEKLEIIAFLNKNLRPFEPERIIGRGVSEEDNQLLAIHQSTLERLERLNEDLIRQSADFREKLEEKLDETVRKNEEELQKKKEILDSEYSSRNSRLESQKKELTDKLKAIDDRNNTHVRRDIRDRMLSDVRNRIEQFGVSKATAQKRKPVLLGIFLLAFSLFCLMFYTTYEIKLLESQESGLLTAVGVDLMRASGIKPEATAQVPAPTIDKNHIYLLWARFTLFSFGFIGTLLYYIKWQNKWAEQHAISEFQLQQFYIDVNRSNWVIESCLEWRKETDSEIPKELLTSITTNLFMNNEAELERAIHPADELASALMGSASKLKLKIGDSELDFDNPRKIENKPRASKSKKTDSA